MGILVRKPVINVSLHDPVGDRQDAQDEDDSQSDQRDGAQRACEWVPQRVGQVYLISGK